LAFAAFVQYDGARIKFWNEFIKTGIPDKTDGKLYSHFATVVAG
jgi:hypothetical protein